MRYLTLNEALEIYLRILKDSGGAAGVINLNGLESAIAQPRMTFDGRELYPSLGEKAAALGFSRIQNHPFLDGNKRTAHAVMESFLALNGFEINASVDEQEKIILQGASGKLEHNHFSEWLRLNH